MLPEPIAVTLQVADALEQVGANYVIGGSLASTIHGVVRTTLDTDLERRWHSTSSPAGGARRRTSRPR
jgi:hypothetical protein